MLVGLNKYVDQLLPALQPHTPDSIKPWGVVSCVKVNIPTLSAERMISSKCVEGNIRNRTEGLYDI